MDNYNDVPNISEKLRKNLKRLPIILCEDISGSMATKYRLLNRHLNNFFKIKELEPEVCRRTDIEIIQFNSTVLQLSVSSLDSYKFVPFSKSDMSGLTHLWSALEKAIQVSKKYIDNPQYWAPWILLYTDGFDNDEPLELQERVKKTIQAYERVHKIALFILGIGDEHEGTDELNPAVLNNVSLRGNRAVLYAMSQEVDVRRFFQAMIKTITSSMTNAKQFVREWDGEYRLDLDQIFDDYESLLNQSK